MRAFTKLISYLKESRDELSKVVWPSRKEVIQYSTIIILSILIAIAFIGGFDILLLKIVQFFVIR
ncbi:MAG: preprotein translocase subunit SecE [Candidatus Berkelbacteria bacterium]|nr:preprotein translocase subunit SecE [Candidatus Berkelbacteria bacterium]